MGRAKYTRARAKVRGDATRRERRNPRNFARARMYFARPTIAIAKIRDYSQSKLLSTPFTRHWNIPGKFPKFVAFILSSFPCQKLHPVLNFLYFGVYVVMTPIFPTNQRKCVISSRIVLSWFCCQHGSTTLLNRLIDSQHCKRHRRKGMREFHLQSLIIHITSQPKTSF